MFDLNGKTALVTGANGGIGRAIVKALHTNGAKVAIFCRSKDKALQIKNELGDRIITLEVGDITQEKDAKSIVEEAYSSMGKLDILVNNAGLTRDGLSIKMTQQQFTEVIDVNLLAPFLLSKFALIKMLKQRWGRVINISSVVGVSGSSGQANYTSAKGGLISLTKTLALEFASKSITVNSISPGLIETNMTESIPEDKKNQILKSIPTGFFGAPEDIAHGVCYLASEEARYINGHNLNINGGLLMI